MFTKAFTTAAVAFAAAGFVSAQTFTDCNPLEKTCPAEPAFGNDKTNCNFAAGECGTFDALPGTTINYDSNGAVFRIEKETNAPTMATHKRMFFGRLDVELRASPGIGVVTSVVLESADLDEIDWEWLGGDNTQVQTNYFGKGDTTTYDRGAFHPVANPVTEFHTYSIEWTSKKVDWIIDGAIVRTLNYEDAKGGSRFPQTPMEVKIGTWVAGRKDAPQGTVEWAGGYTDFSQGPYDAYYKSVSIVDYAGGDAPTKDSIKEYVYGDNTGSWESIKVVKGDGTSNEEDQEEATTTKKIDLSTKTKDTDATNTKTSEKATTTKAVSSTFVTSSANSTTTAPSTTAGPTKSTSVTTTAPPTVTEGSAAAGLSVSFGVLAVAGAVALML